MSHIISNQLRFESDPISTYVGVFGPNFSRIDFHIIAKKEEDSYSITGVSRLGTNIRPLKGEMVLSKLLIAPNYLVDSLYIGLFDCKLSEPGDKSGDGEFVGVFTLIFYHDDKDLQFYSTASGEPPTFTNTFIGSWSKYNSSIKRRCIFSFHVAGLYKALPYCEELYDYEFEDRTKIKEKYVQFGWKNYPLNRGNKTNWWDK